jgi:hypothetical protein
MLLSNLVDLAGEALALAPTPDPTTVPTAPAVSDVDSAGVVKWFATRIAPILLAILGAVFIARAQKGEVGRVMTSSTVAVIGIAFIAGAGVLLTLGGTIIDVLFE